MDNEHRWIQAQRDIKRGDHYAEALILVIIVIAVIVAAWATVHYRSNWEHGTPPQPVQRVVTTTTIR